MRNRASYVSFTDILRDRGLLRRRLKFLVRICLVIVGVGSIAAYFCYRHFSRGLPNVKELALDSLASSTVLYAADGIVVDRIGTIDKRPALIENIPEIVALAFIAAEDRRFFEHFGVDVLATARATYRNLLGKGPRSGASTITQQVSKHWVGRERSYGRKIREAILAFRIERAFGKKIILQRYLNEVYLGQGAYGVRAAASVYFGKSLRELTIAEAAMLAGLPPQPSVLNPVKTPERSRQRQLYVLNALAELKVISSEDAKVAFATYTGPKKRSRPGAWAPFYSARVTDMLEKHGLEPKTDGLTVSLGLRVHEQALAHDALWSGTAALTRRQGYTGPIFRGISPRTQPELDKELAQTNRVLKPLDLAVGLVLTVAKEHAQIQVGEHVKTLRVEHARWARARRLDRKHNRDTVSTLVDVLAPSDLVLVASGPNEDELKLAQTPVPEGAFVAVDNITRYLVSSVGGTDFGRSQFDRSWQACRPPGSTFKPIVYVEALERGLTLATIFEDSPMTIFDGQHGRYWKPRNANGRFRGLVTMSQAITESLNIPAVRALRTVGASNVAARAAAMGIKEKLYADDSLSLGASALLP